MNKTMKKEKLPIWWKRIWPYAKVGIVCFPVLALISGILFKSVYPAIPFLVLFVLSSYFSGYFTEGGGFDKDDFEDD
jgi:hypothetical protein